MRELVAAMMVLLAVRVQARPFVSETKNDKLCRAIGETSKAALQPRDRIFFEENCACAQGACAVKGGARLTWWIEVHRCDEELTASRHQRSSNRDDLLAVCIKETSQKKLLQKLTAEASVLRREDEARNAALRSEVDAAIGPVAECIEDPNTTSCPSRDELMKKCQEAYQSACSDHMDAAREKVQARRRAEREAAERARIEQWTAANQGFIREADRRIGSFVACLADPKSVTCPTGDLWDFCREKSTNMEIGHLYCSRKYEELKKK